jgi:hypothetical protein
MAQLTRYQGLADEAEVIPSEEIESFIAGFNFRARVGLGLAWGRPGRGNVPVNYPRWDAMADGVPAAKDETDEFVERDIAMSESTITPAIFGFALKRSDEANAGSPAGVQAGLLIQGLETLMESIDEDVLGSVASITASEGAVTDPYDLSRFRSDVAAYKLLNVSAGPLGHVAVVSSGMAFDLTTALHSSGATLVTSAGDTLGLGPSDGFLGSLHGFGVYETQALPVSTTGRAGAMMPAGQMASPLGIVVNEMPRVETTRGDEMARRAATQHILRAWYGVGVTNPTKGQQILGPA